MAVENDLVVDNAVETANLYETNNPYDVKNLDKYGKEGGMHNIAAVLNLIQHLIGELHKIEDNIKHIKATATQNWTKQTLLASESTAWAGYSKMIEAAAPMVAMGLKPLAKEEMHKQIDAIVGTGGKMLSQAASQHFESQTQEHGHRGQLSQADKDSEQTASQTMGQSTEAAKEGLRAALNALGSQNKEAAGR